MVLTGGFGVKEGFYIFCFCGFLMIETHRTMAEHDLFPGSGEGISFLLGEGHFSGCGEGGLELERLGLRT